MTAIQKKTEILVITLTALVALSVIGMFLDSAVVMFIAAPLVVAVLLYMSVVDAPAGRGKVASLVAIHIFNVAHTAVWVAMLVLLPVSEPSFWGLPPASGVMVYVFWPISVVAASLLYAYVSKKTGVIDRLTDTDGTAEESITEGAAA